MTAFVLDVNLVVGQFVKRYVVTSKVKQVDNASLYAGSPMVYYCKHCREHTVTLPECHMNRPKTCCDPCSVLLHHGLIPDALKKGKAAVLLLRLGRDDAENRPFDRFARAKEAAVEAAKTMGFGGPSKGVRSWARLGEWATGLELGIT